jgi:hypothetical protein
MNACGKSSVHIILHKKNPNPGSYAPISLSSEAHVTQSAVTYKPMQGLVVMHLRMVKKPVLSAPGDDLPSTRITGSQY